MKKYKYYILIILLFTFLLISYNNSNAAYINEVDIINVFMEKGLPITNITFYTEENDPNNLLGRPGQYIGKVSWADTRVEQDKDSLIGGTIEIFDSKESLENRKKYLEAIVKNPLFAQYMYVHKNVIIRIDNELTPEQAQEYKNVLESL